MRCFEKNTGLMQTREGYNSRMEDSDVLAFID